MIQAIFFDFNGVILDDEAIQMQAYKEVLRGHGIDLTEADYYGALGLDDKGFVRHAFGRAKKDLTDDVLKSVLAAKTIHHRRLLGEELPWCSGIKTFLKATAQSYSLGIVSMATLDEIEYALKQARLLPLFTVVVNADDVNVCKPAPDCYRLGLRRLNEHRQAVRQLPLLPRECLALEDSPPGIESAKAAGMHTLGITNTVTEARLRAAGAEVVTASLADWTAASVHHLFE